MEHTGKLIFAIMILSLVGCKYDVDYYNPVCWDCTTSFEIDSIYKVGFRTCILGTKDDKPNNPAGFEEIIISNGKIFVPHFDNTFCFDMITYSIKGYDPEKYNIDSIAKVDIAEGTYIVNKNKFCDEISLSK